MSGKTPVRIRLPVTSEAEFVERYRAHLARGGLFIATRTTKPEGSELAFELVLRDGNRVLRGEAVVLKVRPEGEVGPPGMVLRFRKLDPRSKELVQRLAAERASTERAESELPSEIEVQLEFTGEGPAPDAAFMLAHSVDERGPTDPASEFNVQPQSTNSESPLPEPPPVEPPRARRRISLEVPVPGPTPPGRLALGLEVGAYRTRVARLEGGRTQLVPLGSADALYLPSALARDEGGAVRLGWAAAASSQPWYGWTRAAGLRADSPLARRLFGDSPYPLAADEQGDVAWRIGEHVIGAQELLTRLMGEVRTALTQTLGELLPALVVCVPSHFGHRQRAALWRACASAGFEVLRFLQGTSAAALAVGHGRGLPRKRVLVCDLGAGGADAAVVELTGNDIESVTAVGDPALGGLELDRALADKLGLEPGRALDALGEAKAALDTAESVDLALPSLQQPVRLSRAMLEETLRPYTEHALALTRTVLEEAGLQPQGLDDVVLAGGNGRAPLIQNAWAASLGKAPLRGVDAEGLAAKGAALLAHALVGAGSGPPFATATDVLTRGLEVVVDGLGSQRVFERRTHLPATKTLEVKGQPGQPLRAALFQSQRGEELEYLGLAEVQPERSGNFLFQLGFDASGVVSVSVKSPGGGAAKTIPVSHATALPPELEPASTPTPTPVSERGGLFRGIRRLLGK